MNIKNIIKSKGLYVFLAGCLFGLAVDISVFSSYLKVLNIFFFPVIPAIPLIIFFGFIMEIILGSHYFINDPGSWSYVSMSVYLIIIYGLIFLLIYKLAKRIFRKRNKNKLVYKKEKTL